MERKRKFDDLILPLPEMDPSPAPLNGDDDVFLGLFLATRPTTAADRHSPPPSPSTSPPQPLQPSLQPHPSHNLYTNNQHTVVTTTPERVPPPSSSAAERHPPPPSPPIHMNPPFALYQRFQQPENISHQYVYTMIQHNPAPDPIAAAVAGNHPRRRQRRNPTRTPPVGKPATVPPPFPWATDLRATVHSIDYLVSKQISVIAGEVQCRRCERHYTMEFDLIPKFIAVSTYIINNRAEMHQRAPRNWLSPALPTCRYCNQENSARPVMAEKKKAINWLFLLLGEMLGCCTLEQLKYFCKHSKHHRTGAKDRVLFLAYLGLCKQLDPSGPFDLLLS